MVPAGAAAAGEALEHPLRLVAADPTAVVDDVDLEAAADHARPELDRRLGRGVVLHRVRQQVDQHLPQPVLVRHDDGARGHRLAPDRDPARDAGDAVERGADRRLRVDGADRQVGRAPLEPADVEDLVEEPGQPLGLVVDDREEPPPLGLADRPVPEQDLGNERIEVIGVRSSWLTWLRKASFWRSSARSRSFAVAQLAAVRSSSSDLSARARASIRSAAAVSSAMSHQVITETSRRRRSARRIACAEAAPTEPAELALEPRRGTRGVGSRQLARAALAARQLGEERRAPARARGCAGRATNRSSAVAVPPTKARRGAAGAGRRRRRARPAAARAAAAR